MPFIAFLGCDGSGKSSVIEAVAAEMAARGVPVTRGHWRPSPLDSNRNTQASADDPHGKPPRGPLASVLKLGWLGGSWWLGWLRGLRARASNGLLIFDRYHADLLVDPRRYRYGGPMALARLATACMPQPDIAFFLDAPADVLLARKNEVPKEALEKSRARYLALARTTPRIRVIDATLPLPHVVAEILNLLDSACFSNPDEKH